VPILAADDGMALRPDEVLVLLCVVLEWEQVGHRSKSE
jgi:hypothetical protein